MEPILRQFPDRFSTERLDIRSPLPGDGSRLRTAVLESQPRLKEWMPWAVEVASEEEYEALVRRARLRFLAREDLWLILLLKGTDTIVGGSGLHRVDWSVPKFEIGYWVRTQYARQGYVTEAVQSIAEFAFDVLDAKRVEIRCDALNHRSALVPGRLGFQHEATLRSFSRHHLTNELRDTLVFTRLAPDPKPS